jgi:hypothetical protein
MISTSLLALMMGAIWTIGSLAVLLPVLGMAWVVARLTDLALAETCLITFLHSTVLVYLLQTYFARSGFSLWFSMLPVSAVSLVVATLEGLLLHNLTDLTLFQAILVTSGASLLIAYMLGHSITGSIPSFLRETIVQDIIDGSMSDDDMSDYIDQEVPTPTPRKKPRKRSQKR